MVKLLLLLRLLTTTSSSSPSAHPPPRLSKILLPSPHKMEVEFSNSQKFIFSSEFLRVQSPGADSKSRRSSGQSTVVSGRKHVGIMSLELVGNYAVRIIFDDLHKTGIYSWDYLYHLGQNKFSLMRSYISQLKEQGLSREPISKK